jgi:hypothetical protein
MLQEVCIVKMRSRRNSRLDVSVLGLLILCAVLLPACGDTTTATSTSSPLATAPAVAFSSPLETGDETPEEGIAMHSTLDAHRFTTAAESFSLAYETAKAWRQDAEWYGVVPFTSMERAFALPHSDDNPSWFFRFGTPDGEAEYLVEVLNGKVMGTNEIKLPRYIEPPLEELGPLGDEWTGMDNVALLEEYLEEENSLLAQSSYMLLDYRLAKPKEQPNPVWTLYNGHDISRPIFVVDAVTGEVLPIE